MDLCYGLELGVCVRGYAVMELLLIDFHISTRKTRIPLLFSLFSRGLMKCGTPNKRFFIVIMIIL